MLAEIRSSLGSQRLASLSILALLACHCAGKSSSTGSDAASVGSDAAPTSPDAEAAGPDADIEIPDGGIADPDAGIADPDAGIEDADAGVNPDAGPLSVPQALQRLSSRTIFFHHKSVGGNIVAGVQDHLADNPGSGVTVVATRTASDLVPGTFAHADLDSSNGTPLGKITDFHDAMEGGLVNTAQIAFMKFCFADFSESTDVNALFTAYSSTLAQLKADHPGVRFVHLTTPLVVGDDHPNITREAFNTLMRNAYAGTEPVFDLARAEATCPDGSVTVGATSGVLGLCPTLTSDGGHLNATGQKAVAEDLLLFLASLPP